MSARYYKAAQDRYRRTHLAYFRDYHRAYRRAHPCEIRAYHREWMRRRRALMRLAAALRWFPAPAAPEPVFPDDLILATLIQADEGRDVELSNSLRG